MFYNAAHNRHTDVEVELPRKIEANGESFSLDFYVRHKAYEITREGEAAQKVYMAISEPFAVPNMKAEGIELYAGKFYEISITPSVTTTDESGLHYKPKKRNCLTRTENEMLEVYNAYSQTACIFECQLRKAVEKCNCTAWDYPKVNQDVPTCAFDYENACFKYVMGIPMKPQYCDCLNDCYSIHYDVAMRVKDLDQETGNDPSSRYNYPL